MVGRQCHRRLQLRDCDRRLAHEHGAAGTADARLQRVLRDQRAVVELRGRRPLPAQQSGLRGSEQGGGWVGGHR
ncbi:MAG: hypothetical protein DYH17_06410 [Xanthomonadales bacterium PRO6]|nr:hypothetical protein [Xanthomonadales bacterium PRO6]